jgi:hypothetical protein
MRETILLLTTDEYVLACELHMLVNMTTKLGFDLFTATEIRRYNKLWTDYQAVSGFNAIVLRQQIMLMDKYLTDANGLRRQ